MIVEMKRRLVIELEKRGVIPIKDAVGTRIDCLWGRIWITEQESLDDQVLYPGESYVISRGGLAVVQALCEARVELRVPAVRPARAGLASSVEWLWRQRADEKHLRA